ncbi:MAG: ChuX/HutX family heme-like substrate-binding protein [Paracoccaceae bacterium]
MCFVGNKGCIQIHSGAIKTVMDKGPWINVLDPNFHLHLRTDHIASVWAVRKPADIEHVTSIEAYDENDNLVIQFFGVRTEGSVERSEWRDLIERLPQVSTNTTIGVASWASDPHSRAALCLSLQQRFWAATLLCKVWHLPNRQRQNAS